MEKQRKTFLSYSRVNKDFALRLARELKAEGFAVWLDQLDIPPGSRWDAEVEKALMESEIFMVIITRSSSASENVLDEIGYAIDNGKRMLPVLLEKTNIPLRLRRFQYVDFTDKSFDEGVQSAKDLLRNLIEQPTLPRMNAAEDDKDRPAAQRTDEVLFPKSESSEPVGQKSEKEGPITATGMLRREMLDKEMSFRAEQARLTQEKADLEKKLEDERSTRDRMPAVPSAKPRSAMRLGIFGIVIAALAVAGFFLARIMLPPKTPQATQTSSAQGTSNAVAPVTLPSDTPTQEAATSTLPSTATEQPADTATPTEAVSPTPSSLITDDKGVEMVLVPAGDFAMGSNRGESDEQPVHIVNLNAYYIDKFEVTNKSYKDCVDAGSCEPPRQLYFFPESPNRTYFGNVQYENYPVVYVDWNEAKAYCEWRGARLPTEAEWEKAARGTDERTYAWGKELSCQRANYQGCINLTSEVGSYQEGVSPYGAYDMTGNVWEWVSDWYSSNYYAVSTGKNPTGPITGQSHIVRGGSWARFDVTAYHRANFAPTYNNFDIGIRCVRGANP